MSPSRRLLNETRRLESSIEVLVALSKPGAKQLEHVEFYEAERPIALEDIENALRVLRSIAAELGEEDRQPNAIYPLDLSKTGTP